MPIPVTSPWEHLWGCAETLTPGFSVLMHVLKSVWLLRGVNPGMVSSEFPPVSVWLGDAFLKLDSLKLVDVTRKGRKAVHSEQQSLSRSRQLSLLSALEIMAENTTGSYREAGPAHCFEWMDSNRAPKFSLWLGQLSFAMAA